MIDSNPLFYLIRSINNNNNNNNFDNEITVMISRISFVSLRVRLHQV